MCEVEVVSGVASHGGIGSFYVLLSVGSTRIISALASRSLYTLDSASARTLSSPRLCII